MNINTTQMSMKPQKVGKLKDQDVYETVTKGGLVVLATGNGSGKLSKILGVGPHRGVARMVAQKKEPELQVTALTKSQEGDVAYNASLVPEYAAIADRMQGMIQG